MPRKKKRLDRFGAHRDFINNTLPALIKGDNRSPAAAIIWFVLWDRANASNGKVHGMTLTKIVEITRFDRGTVADDLQRLIDAGALQREGRGYYPVYIVPHPGEEGQCRE